MQRNLRSTLGSSRGARAKRRKEILQAARAQVLQGESPGMRGRLPRGAGAPQGATTAISGIATIVSKAASGANLGPS
ncbi:hypothetical protein KBC86_02165 [Candidatus Gracilibacteria bacterium]|nr:hypothetical protein [Candidatus Gracilibacteria bacterium]